MTMTDNPRAVIGGNNPPLEEVLRERHGLFRERIALVKTGVERISLPIKDDAALADSAKIVTRTIQLGKDIDETRRTEKQPYLEGGRIVDNFFNSLADVLADTVKPLRKANDDYQREKDRKARAEAQEAARRAREEEERQRAIAEAEAARGRPTAAAKHAEKAHLANEAELENRVAARSSAADLTRVSAGDTVVSAKQPWTFEVTDAEAVDLEALRPYLLQADIEKAIRQFIRVNKGSRPLKGVRIYQDVVTNYGRR